MKIYIAGPMRGLPLFNVPAFNEAEQALLTLGHEPFNPGHIDPSLPIRQMFAIDMDWITREAEAIYMLRGWETSRGARAEHALAVAIDLPIFYQGKSLC